jgi:hypothetical protein
VLTELLRLKLKILNRGISLDRSAAEMLSSGAGAPRHRKTTPRRGEFPFI